MSQGKRKRPMPTEQWVRTLNNLAHEIDATCGSLHPSQWGPSTKDLRDKYFKTIDQETAGEEMSA